MQGFVLTPGVVTLLTAALSVKELLKWYGKEVLALNKVSFDVDEGDFFVIIGPSGCGKSTLLKCVSGILDWNDGDVYIGGKSMRDVPAYKRDIALMPEAYALFPHMRVYDNIAFGLRMHGRPENEIGKEVEKALKLVGLEGFGRRWPSELSGGQRQRISLARAIVVNPKVLLLDEPLSHVDYRLQRKLMEDFKLLHEELGNTWILTTHVQEQGLSMAETLLVMNNGVIEQIGKPEEVYKWPRTVFAARFVGNINLLHGEVVSQEKGSCVVKTELGELWGTFTGDSGLMGRKVAYGVRPENIEISPKATVDNKVGAKLTGLYYFGELVEYMFQTEGGIEMKARTSPVECKLGERYTIGWSRRDASILERPSMIEGLNIEDVIYGR